jgi:hypothetical protein
MRDAGFFLLHTSEVDDWCWTKATEIVSSSNVSKGRVLFLLLRRFICFHISLCLPGMSDSSQPRFKFCDLLISTLIPLICFNVTTEASKTTHSRLKSLYEHRVNMCHHHLMFSFYEMTTKRKKSWENPVTFSCLWLAFHRKTSSQPRFKFCELLISTRIPLICFNVTTEASKTIHSSLEVFVWASRQHVLSSSPGQLSWNGNQKKEIIHSEATGEMMRKSNASD